MSGGLGGGGAADYLLFLNKAASGSAAAITSYAAAAWRTVGLNTESLDAGGHGSIASNVITLAAGDYEFGAHGGFRNDGGNNTVQMRLRNTADSVTLAGINVRIGTTGSSMAFTLSGKFTLAAAKTLELQIFADALVYNDSLMVQTTGDDEVFQSLYFRKVG